MGRRSHLQQLQQHRNPHNRHLRRRNNSPHLGRDVCESRPHGILTLRSHARRNSSCRNGPRQRNNSNTHQSTRSRRIRSKNAWTRRPSRHTRPRPIRIPNRTNRRGYAYSPRWYTKAGWQKRKTCITFNFPCLLTEKLK